MRVTSLHRDFGVEIQDADLSTVSAEHDYPELRALFDRHSLLLFRGQSLDDAAHMRLARCFGPIEDRYDRPAPEISRVANLTDAGAVITVDQDHRLLHLKANFLWHTDSTFLPAPALANILVSRRLPSRGGATEFVSTRAGFAKLPTRTQERLRDTVLWHRYSHSRAKIDPELAKQELFTKWRDQAWHAVWRNPSTGDESLYIASHAYAVDGMTPKDGLAWIDALIEAVTGVDAVYSHEWRLGDVVIWDERATLHRGTPWPFHEARRLDSLCVTARDIDGLATIRPDQSKLQTTLP